MDGFISQVMYSRIYLNQFNADGIAMAIFRTVEIKRYHVGQVGHFFLGQVGHMTNLPRCVANLRRCPHNNNLVLKRASYEVPVGIY